MLFFFFNDTATTEIYTLSLHDALPICERSMGTDIQTGHNFEQILDSLRIGFDELAEAKDVRSEEHTSELQSRLHLVCRLLLEKKKNDNLNGNILSVPCTRVHSIPIQS